MCVSDGPSPCIGLHLLIDQRGLWSIKYSTSEPITGFTHTIWRTSVQLSDTGDHLLIELQTIPTGLTAAGLNVQRGIGHADRAERPVLVREALLDGGVFDFGTPKTELIRYR